MSKFNKAALLENIRQELQGRYPSALKSHYGTATLSLLAIGLTGCGGGGSTSTSTLGGSVIKGPLANALVFVDLDGDGRLDDDEVSATTNADGSYSLSSSDASKLEGTIVVQTNEDTVDSSSGEVLSGLTLSAPEGSAVVSPLTTLINSVVGAQGDSESDEDYQARIEAEEADLQSDLGISQDVDLTSFNPFAAGVDLSAAKAVETVAQQVTAIVNTIAKAVEAAGGDGEAAVTTALNEVATQIEAGSTLTDSSTVTSVLNAVDTADTGADLSGDSTAIANAISEVATTIATEVTNAATLEEAREIFAVSQTTLAEAAASAAASSGSDTVLDLLANSATDISAIADARIDVEGDTSASVEENDATDTGITASGSLTVGDNDDTDAITYRVKEGSATSVGTNTGSLTVDTEGNWTYTLTDTSALNALQNPDNRGSIDSDSSANVTSNFRLTEQFVVTIEQVDATNVDPEDPESTATVTDATYGSGGPVITKIITVNITGNNDAVTVTTDTETAAATEDGAAVAIDLSDNFSDDDTADQLTYSEVVADGESATAGLSATSTGFSFDPTDAAYQGLSADEEQVLTINFRATDVGGETADGVLTLTVTGVNDAPEQASDANITLAATEDGEAVTGTLGLTDVDGDNVTVTVSTQPSTGTVTVTDAATGAFSYDPGSNFQSLSAGEETTETFTLEYTDGTATATQEITVTITGVNDAPVAADRDGITVGDSTTLTIDKTFLSQQISDVDNEDADLSITNVVVTSGPGSISESEGTYTFTPTDVSENTEVVLTYTLSDGTDTDTGTLTLNVVDAIPLGDVNEDGTETLADMKAAAATALGVDASTIELALAASPDTILDADYSPTANFNGTVSFVIKRTGEDDLPAILTVNAVNDDPEGSVTIDGTAAEGSVLTANTSVLTDDDDLGTFSYQWKAATGNEAAVAIDGATNATLTLGQDQVGKTITVEVSYTDGDGTAESVESGATTSVTNVNDAPTGLVISGSATNGATLTADTSNLTDEDGIPNSLSYQWLANGSAIDGATSSTFTLTDSQIGQVISVTVSYTDNQGTAEDITSSETAVVTDPPVTFTYGTAGYADQDGSLVFALGFNDIPTTGSETSFTDETQGRTMTITQDGSTVTGFEIREGGTLVSKAEGLALSRAELNGLLTDGDTDNYDFPAQAIQYFSNKTINIQGEDGNTTGAIMQGSYGGESIITGTGGDDIFILDQFLDKSASTSVQEISGGAGNDTYFVLLDGPASVLGDVIIDDFAAGSDNILIDLDASTFDVSNLFIDSVTEDGVQYAAIRYDYSDDVSIGDSTSTTQTVNGNDYTFNEGYYVIYLVGVSVDEATAAISFDSPDNAALIASSTQNSNGSYTVSFSLNSDNASSLDSIFGYELSIQGFGVNTGNGSTTVQEFGQYASVSSTFDNTPNDAAALENFYNNNNSSNTSQDILGDGWSVSGGAALAMVTSLETYTESATGSTNLADFIPNEASIFNLTFEVEDDVSSLDLLVTGTLSGLGDASEDLPLLSIEII